MNGDELVYRFFGSTVVALNQYWELNHYIEEVVPGPETSLSKEMGQEICGRIRAVVETIGGAVEDGAAAMESEIADSICRLISNTCDIMSEWHERLGWLEVAINQMIWREGTGYIDRLLGDIRNAAASVAEKAKGFSVEKVHIGTDVQERVEGTDASDEESESEEGESENPDTVEDSETDSSDEIPTDQVTEAVDEAEEEHVPEDEEEDSVETESDPEPAPEPRKFDLKGAIRRFRE